MNIDQRLLNIELNVQSMQETNSRIADALERLVILETQHAETRDALNRAFKAVDKLGDRLGEFEKRMPIMDLVLKGAGVGVLGLLGLIGTALWKVLTANGGT
jgi:hypothetical protein